MMPHPTMMVENQIEGRRRFNTMFAGTCVFHLSSSYLPRKRIGTRLEERIRYEEYR